jgi:hypothetical protein
MLGEKRKFHPLLRVDDAPLGPAFLELVDALSAAAAVSFAAAIGPGLVPAIQPARSKLAAPPLPPPDPPASADRLAPASGEERDCFSNSARVSGSTGVVSGCQFTPAKGLGLGFGFGGKGNQCEGKPDRRREMTQCQRSGERTIFH